MESKWHFNSIADLFSWGRYKDSALGDVLECNVSYFYWCIDHISQLTVSSNVIDEIRKLYPNYILPITFLHHITEEYDETSESGKNYFEEEKYENNTEPRTYEQYSGSYAQDVAGYSDEDIDTIFDGDPNAYWNID